MLRIEINGIVQGVGFRPFVYNLATKLTIYGYVLNSSKGVEIEAEGSAKELTEFNLRLQRDLPVAAKIEKFQSISLPDKGYSNFEIRESLSIEGLTFISPDLASCSDCVHELNDPQNPRFNYPFINCTNCGPRYTIIKKTPYDRPFTSMRDFVMCELCKTEYIDPSNRRFHAQPIACPKCGPKLRFLDRDLQETAGNPLKSCIKALKTGKIVGIKGLGGFHIACDATAESAVAELRKRKSRPHKPFAVMCSEESLETIVKFSKADLRLLKSASAPILLLPKQTDGHLAESVAPLNPYLGVFLPYTPLHFLLFKESRTYLVMSSANINDEPIATDEKMLIGLCDCFLTHDRRILNRNDDSVILPTKKDNIFIRRSRGYVPSPVKIPFDTVPTIGTGPELKITFALTNRDSVYVSPYIGSNSSKATADFYFETYQKYTQWFGIKPELAACDLHPDFMTTRFAESLNLPLVRIQHHKAHLTAVMAEKKLVEPIIGVCYDGTGLGEDNQIWGGEIFYGDYSGFIRRFHLNYMPLPGGDAAINHPVRTAFAYLQIADEDAEFLDHISETEKKIIKQQLNSNFLVFQTSSMGRLFDAVSAMMGLFPHITFEAQSAMALEFLCGKGLFDDKNSYPYFFDKTEMNIIPLLKEVRKDIIKGINKSEIAMKFHRSLINMTVDAVQTVSKETGIKKVIITGGVMQNTVLFQGLIFYLKKNSFTVIYPSLLPFNDGSVCIGQAVMANCLIKS